MELYYYVVMLTIFYYEIVKGDTENTISVDTLLTKDENVFRVGLGSSATFKCRPTSNNQKVEWFNPEGENLSRSGGRILVQEHFVSGIRSRMPYSVLTITGAQIEDTGVWQCQSGETVLDIPICVLDPVRFVDTKTYTVDEGRSITLTCQALGKPDPIIVWSRNGDVISDDDSSEKYKTMTKYNSEGYESLLTITEVGPEDHGVYTCEGTQSSWRLEDCTHTNSVNITLNVNYAPIFVIDEKTSRVFANFNTTVTLNCTALGYPPPVYTWYLETNDTMTELKGFDHETGTFSFVADDTTMGQTYKCRANNSYGHEFKSFTLLELLKPENPDTIEVSTSYDAVDINLIWDSELLFPVDAILCQYMKRQNSRKPTESNWKKAKLIETEVEDDTLFSDDFKTYTLSLTDLEQDTEYWFRIRLNNELSASRWSKPVVFTTKSIKQEHELYEFLSTTEQSRPQENDKLESTAEAEENDYQNSIIYRETLDLKIMLSNLAVPIYITCIISVILLIGLVLTVVIKIMKQLSRNREAGKSNALIYLPCCFILLVIIIGYLYNTLF